MSNTQVFYRKWRPQVFADVSGQQHVTSTLRRAVATGRVSHAYLFTGPRGVGKTSCARILAKALNCLGPKDGEPDNTCSNCRAVMEDRMLDLIEIDAASNRGIDDIRKLRDGVAFQPVAAQWKVYIIDEVHMLTDPAFNALLKTLEEPPPRVVLVLATTDVHKVPATIISRCQRYDFKRLSGEDVIDRLVHIAEAEGIEAEPEVLDIVARAAWGSLRDAENILEQLAVSYGGLGAGADGDREIQRPEITAAQARELLGIGDSASAAELAAAVLAADTAKALTIVNREAAKGADLRSLRAGAIEALRAAMLIKSGVQDAQGQAPEVIEAMRSAARGTTLDRILHSLSTLGQADLKDASSSPLPLELAVVRATASPSAGPAGQPAATQGAGGMQRPAAGPASAPAARIGGPARPYQQPSPPGSQTVRRGAPPRPVVQAQVEDEDAVERKDQVSPSQQKWAQVTHALRRVKFRKKVLGTLLKTVETAGPEDGKLTLIVRHKTMHEYLEEELQDARTLPAIEEAVEQVYGERLKVVVVSSGDNGGAARSAASESPLVRAALAMGGRIVGEENEPNR